MSPNMLILWASLAHAHMGHSGDSSPWDACETQLVGAECSFTRSSGDVHRGTCRQVQDHTMCVRNKPVESASSQPSNNASWMVAAGGGLALLGFGVGWRRRRPAEQHTQ